MFNRNMKIAIQTGRIIFLAIIELISGGMYSQKGVINII